MRRLKAWERLGRRWLLRIVGAVLRVRPGPIALPERAKILLLRTDPRLGNVILLTPVMATLRRRYPRAQIDVLGHPQGAQILASHPALDHFFVYRKGALWHACGPLATLWRLRRRHYDVCIDLSNPTDPSATQRLLARLSGAQVTVGARSPSGAQLVQHAVDVTQAGAHEIAKRLAVLAPLPGRIVVQALTLGPLALRPSSAIPAFVHGRRCGAYAVVNVGARLATKRLHAADYARIAGALTAVGLQPLLTWGPQEYGLAQAVSRLVPEAVVAPATDVPELAHVMAQATCVVSCDTGPMHLAVALGRPTCGLFVSTDMARFGHHAPPHACVAVAGVDAQVWLAGVRRFVQRLTAPVAPAVLAATVGGQAALP